MNTHTNKETEKLQTHKGSSRGGGIESNITAGLLRNENIVKLYHFGPKVTSEVVQKLSKIAEDIRLHDS